MPVTRILEHGAHPLLSDHPLFRGCNMPRADNLWAEDRGQALLEIEFLTRHAGVGAAVYTRAPRHLGVVSQLFADVSFVAYGAEYDPEAHANVRAEAGEFGAAQAREWGVSGREFLLIGGQGEAPLKHLLHHALMRPAFSLLALSEVPPDFLSGELRLPLCTSFASPLVYLVAPGHAGSRLYYPEHMLDELAHHQVVRRAGEDYDAQAEDQILEAYARRAGADKAAVRALLPLPG